MYLFHSFVKRRKARQTGAYKLISDAYRPSGAASIIAVEHGSGLYPTGVL